MQGKGESQRVCPPTHTLSEPPLTSHNGQPIAGTKPLLQHNKKDN